MAFLRMTPEIHPGLQSQADLIHTGALNRNKKEGIDPGLAEV